MEIEITGRRGAIRANRLVEIAEDLGLDRVSVVVKEGWGGDNDRIFLLTWGRERKCAEIPVGSLEAKAIHIIQQALLPPPKPAPVVAAAEDSQTEAPKKRGRKPKNEDQSL